MAACRGSRGRDYADDALIVFGSEKDPRRVLEVLPKRFAEYDLTLHPAKTRLIAFQRPDRRSSHGDDHAALPGTFDLLGFTRYWDKSRRGTWVVKRKMDRDRFSRALKRVAEWCRSNRHLPVREQRRTLDQKLRGHFGCYRIPGNYEALHRFCEGVKRAWRRWLNRRSQKSKMTWDRMSKLLQLHPPPRPRILRAQPPRSESVFRSAGCLNRARPDPRRARSPTSCSARRASRFPLAAAIKAAVVATRARAVRAIAAMEMIQPAAVVEATRRTVLARETRPRVAPAVIQVAWARRARQTASA